MDIVCVKIKGVSPVIATVLMIGVAVALAVIIYAWASGYTHETTERAGISSPHAFWVVNESSYDAGGNFVIYIRLLTNEITTPSSSFDIYLNGIIISSSQWTVSPGFPGDTVWNGGEVWYFTILGAGTGDSIKIIHKLTGYYVAVIAP